jgi:1,2-diacylglycerol 3-alpha-glucosyltransferase
MTQNGSNKKALLIWGNWGPYHYARYRGFKKACEENDITPLGLELFQRSNIYEWSVEDNENGITHFDFGDREMDFPVWKCITQLIPHLWNLKVDYVLVPSYWHWSLLANFVCRIRGAKIIMMNESHADTERATGLKRWIKRQIVKRFHAGFVGGQPHVRHFASLGLKESSIFIGYDAIDVDYFSRQADEVRASAHKQRTNLNLPTDYILSLSRMVEKKNLPRLVEAYAQAECGDGDTVTQLVFVGSGPTEQAVRSRVRELDLPLYEHAKSAPTPTEIDESKKGVHFYGFRQIQDNPAFFALAKAFIMPSLWEEWGLVVNEALACGTPVLVAKNAGCAEDLVIEGITGYTFDPYVTESIVTELNRLQTGSLATDKTRQETFKLAQKFDCDNFGRNAIAAIRSTLSYQ